MNYFWIALSIWNFIVFIIYGADKLYAKKNLRRIKESTLLICSVFMCASGAMAGMVLFNHKTKKTKFCLITPLAFILNAIITATIYYKY